MKIEKAGKQKGFTIIELVVVILLLGILTATALPRFMDVTEQAHDAAVSGTLGGFGTGVALFRAQWVANGQPAAATAVTGFGDGTLETTATGYPAGTDNGVVDIDAECMQIWNGVLQGGRPTIAANATALTAPTQAEVDAATTDWLTWFDGGCNYGYVLEGVTPIPTISYNAVTGEISLGATTLL